ncbi:MAG: hypothetical protein MZU97_26580 [Bacillus subtilis]|nr:hypothetical protein [Bacillus subtilis]
MTALCVPSASSNSAKAISLRAFVDNFIQILNDQRLIDSNIVVVQPVPVGRVRDDGSARRLVYLVFGRHARRQNRQVAPRHRCPLGVHRSLHRNLMRFLDQARNPELQVVFPNTTGSRHRLFAGNDSNG